MFLQLSLGSEMDKVVSAMNCINEAINTTCPLKTPPHDPERLRNALTYMCSRKQGERAILKNIYIAENDFVCVCVTRLSLLGCRMLIIVFIISMSYNVHCLLLDMCILSILRYC